MPPLNYFGAGPQIFGSPTVTWSSPYSNSVFGYNGEYGFADNGRWNIYGDPSKALVMAGTTGTNILTATMTFQFASPVSEAGGFLNYALYNGGPDLGPETIAVYDSSDNLIEADVLGFSTGGGINTGRFVGFSETTPIAFFTLTGLALGITDLTVSAAIPEPSIWVMMLAGLAALGHAGYRTSRKARLAPVCDQRNDTP
jgi:hypothetical protein